MPLVDLEIYKVPPLKRKSPRWIREEPIVVAGAWEPLFHRRRCGESVWVDDEDAFAYEHSEEFVKDLKRIGCNILITSFEKNYQLDEDEIALKKQLAGFCRKHKLRLATYIRADQTTREIFPDGPAGAGGFMRRADGRIPSYNIQEWRRYVCMHNPEILEKYKETIRRAIEELGVDALHFDGFAFGGTEGVDACRCDKCKADFTEFLKLRYGNDPDLAKKRFGHANLENIEPPGMIAFPPIPTGAVTRPDWQEWLSFRCTWSTKLCREISEYVYELNPDVAIIGNNPPAVKENMALMSGEDSSSFFEPLDVLFCEDAYSAEFTSEGRVIHRARQTKIAHACGSWLMGYVDRGAEDDKSLWRNMAHDAAYNMGRIPHIGWTPYLYLDFHTGFETKRKFISWVEDNWDIYQGLEHVSEFTVWRSELGRAFADPLAYAEFVQVEQLLVEERLPFEIALDSCLDRLDPLKVLIIPNVDCMTDEQGEKIMNFVRAGGGLLIGRTTSLFDGWYRRRRTPLLKPVMQGTLTSEQKAAMKHIAHAGAAVEFERSGGFSKEVQYFRSGKGRVVYVPSFVDPASLPNPITVGGSFDTSLDYTNWRVPENAEDILAALKWLRGNRYRFRVEAARGVLAEYYHQASTNSYMIHIVNLHIDKPARNVVVRMNLQGEEEVRDLKVVSPDKRAPGKVEWQPDALGVTIAIDEMQTYAVVIISLAP